MKDTLPEAIGQIFGANLSLNAAEIEQRTVVVESLPRYVKITHSTQCNLDCVMCYQDRRSPDRIPERFYEHLDQTFPVLQELILLGGEPFVIPTVRSLLALVPSLSCPDLTLGIITNGTIFDRDTVALVANAPIAWMIVSVDAATPDTYARIRRNGRLATTLRGIRTWSELRAVKPFELSLAFTVMRDNVSEMGEFVVLAKSLRLDCGFSPVNGSKGGQDVIPGFLLEKEVRRALGLLRHQSDNDAPMPLAFESLNALLGQTVGQSSY